jgi:WD40 repeat protein/serine/threonine protein kinase
MAHKESEPKRRLLPGDPAMNERSIFIAALEKDDANERAAYLDQACAGDVLLRQRIERLLKAHEGADSFLERPLVAPVATVNYEPIVERPGTVIRPYKLLQQIGEGGMGLVFVAEQQHPVRRRVALKIIKPGMDSQQVIARFEAERQALALMDHQNIAKVLDAGTTPSARPYFVMELVHGVPITTYCDANQLTPRQRLELFVPVCLAIQHAHQKGIIHRDIKPSNVLVTMYDDKPVPKVIDFGVAKATEQRLTEKTVYTAFGTLVGTFEYMSPEQAEMNAFGVDTRSDIYSLGVLLYELLTGTTPLERPRLQEVAFGEIVRLIKEEEPPLPSSRLSTSGELAKVAAARKTDPAKLSRLMRGELDWVVMKCLEKQRTRRYDSAGGLARDVERFLKDEPIEARPPSAWYRFQKFAQRHKVVLTTAALVAAALITGTIVSAWQALRATAAESEARRNEEAAQEQKLAADLAKDEAVTQRDELRRLNYIADINLAQHAWEANNLVRTRQLLEQHRPKPGEDDLRGFEWHYLERLFHRDLLTIKAHAGLVSVVAFSPDGKRLFSCGKARPRHGMERGSDLPGEIKLWDAATGQRVDLALDGSTDAVARIALSADGTYLGATCGLKGIQVWNLATRQRFDLKTPAKKLALAVGFSPDSKRLVALFSPEDVSQNRQDVVTVYDLATRDSVWTLNGIPFVGRYAPAFSPDGKYLAMAHYLEGLVRVVDAATGREAFSCKYGEGKVNHAIFSPDGKSLAASGDLGASIWNVATHQKRLTCQSAAPVGYCLAYSPDSKQLAMASGEGLIELWDADTGQKSNTFKGHAGDVRTIIFSPAGKYLASSGHDGSVRVWDTTARGDVVPILKEPKRLGFVDFSPDGQTLLVGIMGAIDFERGYMVDATTGQRRGEPIHFDCRIYRCFDWTADGKHLIGPGVGKTIRIYDTGTGALVSSFAVDRESVCVTAISPDGRWFAHSAPAATIKVRDAQTGAERQAIRGLTDEVHNLAISPDGSRLAGADTQGWVKAWDVATGRESMSIQIRDMYLSHMRFSPDGKRLAIVGNDSRFLNGEARILDADTGREIMQLAGHTGLVLDVTFSPDGQRVATASWDRTIRMWDARTGQETLTLRGHTLQINSVRFLSDGHRLISASVDQTIRLWGATPLPD